MGIPDSIESDVRSYCRAFPAVFESACNARVTSTDNREYIDFFAGAGALNYGHNHPQVKAALIAYLQSDGLLHALDMATAPKIEFLEKLSEIILKPRGLDYRVQFTGPTGANAVEASIKLARKATGRSHVIAFTNAYHGHSLGALALTGNQRYHNDVYGARNNVSMLPYDGYFGECTDTAGHLRQLLNDNSSGIPVPAAIILETIQAEGGINVASSDWLQQVRDICNELDIVFIIDDIQAGNGRSGDFFSFELAGVVPDMVCMSKSIGGGLPLSLVLIKPELDVWEPGEHTGTFRGNQLAFVAANQLLPYWNDSRFKAQLSGNCSQVEASLTAIAECFPGVQHRGRGMLRGLDVGDGQLATLVAQRCFSQGLLIETAGAQGQVIKFLAPLTIDNATLQAGFQILQSSMVDVYTQLADYTQSKAG